MAPVRHPEGWVYPAGCAGTAARAGVRGLLLEGESGLTVVLGRLLGVTQAEAQRERRGLLIEDGWTYFIHGWTQVIAEVFHIDITGERLAACDRLAREMRK